MLDTERIALNRIVYPGVGMEEFFAITAELGLGKVELRNDLPGGKIIDDLTPDQVRKLAAKHQVQILTINALQKFNLPSNLAKAAQELKGLIELARYFRAHPPARTVVFLATSAHHLAMRGIDDHMQPCKSRQVAVEARFEELDVAAGRVRQTRRLAEVAWRYRLAGHIEFCLYRQLQGIVKLLAGCREQLDPVVGPGIVRRRHHGPDRATTLGFEGDLRRRRDAEADHVESFQSEPVAQRTIEDLGGLTGVPAHHDARDTIGTEHPSRGAAEPGGELGGQFGEGDTSDAVGAELHRANPISAW